MYSLHLAAGYVLTSPGCRTCTHFTWLLDMYSLHLAAGYVLTSPGCRTCTHFTWLPDMYSLHLAAGHVLTSPGCRTCTHFTWLPDMVPMMSKSSKLRWRSYGRSAGVASCCSMICMSAIALWVDCLRRNTHHTLVASVYVSTNISCTINEMLP